MRQKPRMRLPIEAVPVVGAVVTAVVGGAGFATHKLREAISNRAWTRHHLTPGGVELRPWEHKYLKSEPARNLGHVATDVVRWTSGRTATPMSWVEAAFDDTYDPK